MDIFINSLKMALILKEELCTGKGNLGGQLPKGSRPIAPTARS